MPQIVSNPMAIGNRVKHQKATARNGVVHGDIKATAVINGANPDLAGAKNVGANPHRGMNCTGTAPQRNRKRSTMMEMSTKTVNSVTPEVGLTNGSGLVLPEKKQIQRHPQTNWFRRKKKSESHLPCPKAPVPPQEQEDWDKEIQEVNPIDWAQVSYGLQPYGPEDVLSFDLQEMTLCHNDPHDLPMTANYNPAKRHPRPVKWLCYKQSTEADQFADAED